MVLAGLLFFSSLAHAGVAPANWRQMQSDKVWEETLRKTHFQDREIIEGAKQDLIILKAPHAAEDATLVPISLRSNIPQSQERYIKKITLLVDKNPVPLIGHFYLTPDTGKADMAMRIRVDDFTYVRAIAETNDGKLYMTKSFVRAKGACSAPPPASMEDSRRLLGKMKMKSLGEVVYGEPSLLQLMIRHPNITGMAPIRIGSRVRPPPFFVKEIAVDFEGKPVLKAELTFSISMDPSFRFFFIPDRAGTLKVWGKDTKNNEFESTHQVTAST
jgi:sulfur-oxidizing protein SoxY